MVDVTVVTGPPGSGKSTWVRERARWGDLVVDVDALYEALSGLPAYEKPQGLLPVVLAAREAALRTMHRAIGLQRAWIVTSTTDHGVLLELQRQYDAEMVVMEVPAGVCLERIGQDPRRAGKVELWRPLVERWWRGWTPLAGATVVRE